MFSAPTAALVFDPAVNHAPTVVTQVAEPGLFDTSALQDQPITLSLPLVTTFTDDQTPAANLIYTATLADGSALETIGLSFATTPDGAGGVTGGVITGTPPAGFFGTIDIRVKAADAGDLPSPTSSPSMCGRPTASRAARRRWVPLPSLSTSALSSTASILSSSCSRS